MNSSFEELVRDDKLSDIYGDIATLSNKILIFDKEMNKDAFRRKREIFIYSENVLYSAYLIFGKKFTLSHVLAMYTGMIETFVDNLDNDSYKIAMKSVYYLKGFAKTEKNLISYLKFYLNQSNTYIKDIKMFKWSNNRKDHIIISEKLKFYDERKTKYKDILLSVESRHLNENKKVRNSKVDYRVENVIKKRIDEKKKVKNGILDELNLILNDIDEDFIENMGEYYSKQINKIKLYDIFNNKITESEEKFKLPTLFTHLAGKTGAGKTVYTDIIIKKLANEGKKILIVTDTTNNSVNYKERLDKLGIKSTVLVGKRRLEYIDRYYNSKVEKEKLSYKFENPFKTIIRNKSIIDNLDDFCLRKNWVKSEDFDDIEHRKECNNCEDGFLKCGYYGLYREMIESDVIIGTAKTLLLSKTPYVFDSSRRSLLEFGMIYSDLLIVDEVDEIQKEFDGAFLDEIKIYSGSSVDDTHSRGDVESLIKIVNNIERLDITTKNNVKTFKEEVRILDNIINVLISMFLRTGNQDFIREVIGVNQNFNLIYLIECFFDTYVSKIKGDDEQVLKFKNQQVEAYYNFFTNKKKINLIKENYFKLLHEYDVDKIDLEDEFEETIEELSVRIFSFLKKDLDEFINSFNEELKVKLKILRETKKKSKDKREEDRAKFLIFIMLIALIDYYYKNIRINLRAVVPYVKKSKENGLRDLVFRYLYKEDIPLVPESFLDSFISGYSLIEETENKKSTLILKKSNYNGIGREALFNTTKNISALYDIPEVPMLMASATSIDTKGSLYTIKYGVNRLLENDNQKKSKFNKSLSRKELKKLRSKYEARLKIKCHIFSDDKGTCFISGSSMDSMEENIKRMARQLNEKLLLDLRNELNLYKEKNKNKKGILITTSSAKMAKVIFEQINISGIKKRLLYTPAFKEAFNENIHIEKANVEKIADFDIDILIAVNKSISRGYNIMTKNGEEAYFRHIIIANRYLPSPSDNLTIVSYLHDNLTRQFMKNKKNTSIDFKSLKSKIGKLQIKLKYQKTYNSKDDDIKNMIAGNMFADLSQLKGRGQRGGASCIIHLIDSKFYPQTSEFVKLTGKSNIGRVIEKENVFDNGEYREFDDTNCIFNKFMNILDKNDPLIMRLFDDMIEAFENHDLVVH